MLHDPEFNRRVGIAGYRVGYSPPEAILATLLKAQEILKDPVLLARYIEIAGNQ